MSQPVVSLRWKTTHDFFFLLNDTLNVSMNHNTAFNKNDKKRRKLQLDILFLWNTKKSGTDFALIKPCCVVFIVL